MKGGDGGDAAGGGDLEGGGGGLPAGGEGEEAGGGGGLSPTTTALERLVGVGQGGRFVRPTDTRVGLMGQGMPRVMRWHN